MQEQFSALPPLIRPKAGPRFPCAGAPLSHTRQGGAPHIPGAGQSALRAGSVSKSADRTLIFASPDISQSLLHTLWSLEPRSPPRCLLYSNLSVFYFAVCPFCVLLKNFPTLRSESPIWSSKSDGFSFLHFDLFLQALK